MQKERDNKLVFIKKSHIQYIQDSHKAAGFRYQNDFIEHMIEFYQQYGKLIQRKEVQLEPNKVYNGDCLALLPMIPDNSVDLIICDLPYQVTNCNWDKMINLEQLWPEYERVIKENGAILLFAQQPFTATLIKSNPKLFKYEWVWEKTHVTGHLNAKKMPMRSHESVLVFYKKAPSYHPIKTEGHIKKSVKASSRKKLKNEIWNEHPHFVDYSSTERYPRSIIKFKSDRQTESLHPAQKPLDLIQYFLRTYSNENDIILDNCSGSGTLAVACLNTNRRYICIEKDESFYKISLERIARHIDNQNFAVDSLIEVAGEKDYA